MRQQIWPKIFLLFLLLSCNQTPKLNYSREKLVNVTKDLYIAAESIRRIDEVRADSLREIYNVQIETIHEIQLPLYEEDIKTLKLDYKSYIKFHSIVRDSLQVINDSIVKVMNNKKK